MGFSALGRRREALPCGGSKMQAGGPSLEMPSEGVGGDLVLGL